MRHNANARPFETSSSARIRSESIGSYAERFIADSSDSSQSMNGKDKDEHSNAYGKLVDGNINQLLATLPPAMRNNLVKPFNAASTAYQQALNVITSRRSETLSRLGEATKMERASATELENCQTGSITLLTSALTPENANLKTEYMRHATVFMNDAAKSSVNARKHFQEIVECQHTLEVLNRESLMALELFNKTVLAEVLKAIGGIDEYEAQKGRGFKDEGLLGHTEPTAHGKKTKETGRVSYKKANNGGNSAKHWGKPNGEPTKGNRDFKEFGVPGMGHDGNVQYGNIAGPDNELPKNGKGKKRQWKKNYKTSTGSKASSIAGKDGSVPETRTQG